MKYENYDKAGEIIKEIDGYVDAHQSIDGCTVMVSNDGQPKYIFLAVSDGFESEYSEITKEYRANLKNYMEKKIAVLRAELELL